MNVDPTVDVSLRTGSVVGAVGGKKPSILADVTVPVPVPFIAETITRIFEFAISNVGMYVEVVEPPIFIQEIAFVELCHW